MIRAVLVVACCIAAAACASEPKVVWTRTDGRPVVQALLQIDQTDCREDAQKAAGYVTKEKIESLKVQAKTDVADCMAQRGYAAAAAK
jgi:hypothetical protein